MSWTRLVSRHAVIQERKAENLGKDRKPPPTEEDVASFIWLSAEEKKKVIAKLHSHRLRQTKREYLEEVRLRGSLMELRYHSPSVLRLFQDIAKISGDPTGKSKKLLNPQEWKTPKTQVKLELSEDEEVEEPLDESLGKEPFEGIIPLDDATKEKVNILAQEAIERYKVKLVARDEPENPMNNLETALAEEKEINRLLHMAGYKKPEDLSKCVRAGLIRGHFGFKFTGEASQLDSVVQKAKCTNASSKRKCSGTLQATVRKLLEQEDYPGLDYENNSKEAAIKCGTCGRGQYLSHCCEGKPEWDDGKFHNHCKECPGLGVCIGDYRNQHCHRCGGHFFAGFCVNFACSCSKLFRMISKAKKGDRAALAGLYFNEDSTMYAYDDDDDEEDEDLLGSGSDSEDDCDDGSEGRWETEDDWETDMEDDKN